MGMKVALCGLEQLKGQAKKKWEQEKRQGRFVWTVRQHLVFSYIIMKNVTVLHERMAAQMNQLLADETHPE